MFHYGLAATPKESHMDAQKEFTSWRDTLAFLTKNTQEKHRIAREANVSVITLRRWVSGESNPREENLRQLLGSIPPEYTAQFRRMLEIEYPSLAHAELTPGKLVAEIPADLYAQV